MEIQKTRVLIVEDSEVIVELIKAAIQDMNCSVAAVVVSGEEAVTKAIELKPDLILMDIMLEGEMTGIEASFEIKQHLDIPIIYLTGESDRKVLDDAKKTDPLGYVLKPFKMNDLMVAITFALHRHSLEQKLKQSEENYRTLVENIHLGVYKSSFDNKDYRVGNILFANSAMAGIFGYESEEQITGIPFADLYLNPPDREAFLNEIIDSLSVKNRELLMKKRDGTQILCSCTAVIQYRDYDNTPIIYGVIEDITERKAVENSLRDSQKKLSVYNQIAEVFLTASDDEVFEKNLKIILDVLKSSHGIFGYIDDDNFLVIPFMSEKTAEMFNIDSRDVRFPKNIWMDKFWPRVIAQKNIIVKNSPFIVRNDGQKADRAMLMPIMHSDRIIGVLCVFNKKTDYNEEDKEILKSIVERITPILKVRLQRDRLQRAADFRQSQLLQTEKLSSIGTLAAGIAHEINNPMAFILGNLGVLDKYMKKINKFIDLQNRTLESKTSAEEMEIINNIKTEMKIDHILKDVDDLIQESISGADRVKTIVQNLKNFARPDEVELRVVDINECIETTIEIVWNELKYKAELVKEYGNLPLIKCHPQEINQVVMNLLVNAAHAIEKSGTITIRTWQEKGYVFISITDTGSGIPDEHINRIFEPFFTTKDVGQGTGLGLSIVYDIIKKQGGDISVKSKTGEGTEFVVKLLIN